MTRPALRPLTAATLALVAGAAGVVPATAAGKPSAPSRSPHLGGAGPQASVPPVALPAQVGAAATRGHGAGPAELAASGVAAAGGDIGRSQHGIDRAAGRPPARPVRVRGPPR
jgi:hypothetical protein